MKWANIRQFCLGVQLNAFLRRCMMFGYRERDAPSVEEIFAMSDDQLFSKINSNSLHILQRFMPDRPSSNYSLRARPHNKTLIAQTTQLNDQDFIIRSIHKDSYWLHFKHIHHASIRALYVYWLSHLLTILCISIIVHMVAFVNLILKEMVALVVVVVVEVL